MKLLKYQGDIPICVEGFPSDTERSVKGSIHLLPSKTIQLTDDEYAYIKANRDDISKKLIILRSW